MSFHFQQFKDLITRVTKDIGLYSPSAVNLLLGTAAVESQFGRFLRQLGNGPAVSVFQIEPVTYRDIWTRYLSKRPDLAEKIKRYMVGKEHPEETAQQIEWNLALAICMARVFYLRIPAALPPTEDVHGLAAYWKRFYNTSKGAGSIEEFIGNYGKYCH